MQARVKSLRGGNPASAGHCAIGPDDLHHGKYLRCTMTRKQAEKECLQGLNSSIVAGYAVMIFILLTIGGLIWAF